MNKPYFLLFKTAQSEYRVWKHLDESDRFSLSPIIELTRGRMKRGKSKDEKDQQISKEILRTSLDVFDFEKNLNWVSSNLSTHPGFALDMTRVESLECAEIIALKNPTKGYVNWCNLCEKYSEQSFKVFPVIQSTVLPEDTENTYLSNLELQFDRLSKISDTLFYRAVVLDDAEFFIDLIHLKDKIQNYINCGNRFSVIFDHEFIRSGTGILHALRTAGFIANLRSIISNCSIIILGTSFPRDVEELGDPENGSFTTEENYLYDEVIRQTNDPKGIFYGDYGSINPERFDGVTRGWRPRIDFPTSNKRIIYHREKRKGQGFAYAPYYKSVAKKIVSEELFKSEKMHSWGMDMIRKAAQEDVPASAPAFWTSVRMEIFIKQQLKRIV